MNNNAQTGEVRTNDLLIAIRTLLRGVAQVMFQCNAWTGLLFLAGIFWGSYENGCPRVAWGAIVGVVFATLGGVFTKEKASDGEEGLWGFNGALVGCGFGTFLGSTWLMWISMAFFAMMSTWVRRALNNTMAAWKINSLTFPFVLLTWIFLFSTHLFTNEEITPLLSVAVLPSEVTGTLDYSFGSLVIYWLKGISQVFLINSWVTGLFFLAALFVSNKWAGIWAAAGSAISLAIAILFHADPSDIANGLFGFSPVLTAIALGMTFYSVNWKSAIWTVLGIIATVFVQAAMDAFFEPWGLPTLTGPFCITTWLFLLPLYKFNVTEPDHSFWGKKRKD